MPQAGSQIVIFGSGRITSTIAAISGRGVKYCPAPPFTSAAFFSSKPSHGRTADERPCTTIENPVPVQDLHATIYHALGIPPTTSYVVEKRPVYVTNDGKGKPIRDLFELGETAGLSAARRRFMRAATPPPTSNSVPGSGTSLSVS